MTVKNNNLQRKEGADFDLEFSSTIQGNFPDKTLSGSFAAYRKSHKLLTFQEEQEIGRTMEAGKQAILHSLYESPKMIAAIKHWRKGMEEGLIRVFDIVDSNFMKPTKASPSQTSIDAFDDDAPNDAGAADEDIANTSDEMLILPEVVQLLCEIEEIDQKHKISQCPETKEKLLLLMDKIYLNKRLMEEITAPFLKAGTEIAQLDKQMLRMAKSCGVTQGDFLKNYDELKSASEWADKIRGLKTTGWQPMLEQHEDKIRAISARISALANEAGLSNGDFRRVVSSIKKSCMNIEKARTKLIEHNFRLVCSIAKKHLDMGMEYQDLVQDGNIGLMKAADGFDYRLGHRFSTYATYSIMQKIKRTFPERGSLIRIPLHVYEMKGKIRKARQQLQEDGEHVPSKKIARTLRISAEKIERHRYDYQYNSLNAPQGHGGGSDKNRTLSDLFFDKKNPTLEVVSRILNAELLERALSHKNITPQEKNVIELRYFSEDGEIMSFVDVGKSLGFSRERARVLEQQAIEKLKKIISPEHQGQWSIGNPAESLEF